MNEYERSFYEDIREKKKAATGAYHKATRGKRAFTVHNQSDNLTAKELRAMSGEVVSFMQKPITWQEFKEQPVEAQRRYIEWLRDEYKASLSNISEMLGVHYQTLLGYNKNNLWVTFSKGRQDFEERVRWEDFIHGASLEEDPVEVPKEVETAVEHKDAPKVLRNCSITAGSMTELLEALEQIAPIVADGEISVNFQVYQRREGEWDA